MQAKLEYFTIFYILNEFICEKIKLNIEDKFLQILIRTFNDISDGDNNNDNDYFLCNQSYGLK